MNGPFAMDEDPDHHSRPLFPRKGLMFKRVPKAFLIVDYDAQLAAAMPWGILTLSAAQTIYFFYYISTHSENSQVLRGLQRRLPWAAATGSERRSEQRRIRWRKSAHAPPTPASFLVLSFLFSLSLWQGEVSAWTGVAGDSVLYLQSMGFWPSCENLIWGDGEYWRLASYQMVRAPPLSSSSLVWTSRRWGAAGSG